MTKKLARLEAELTKSGQKLFFNSNSKVGSELQPLSTTKRWPNQPIRTELPERALEVVQCGRQRSVNTSPILHLNNLTLIDSNANAEKSKVFLTPNELADLLSISIQAVYRLVNKRQIPFNKIGGSLRFRKTDIDKFLDSQRIEPIKL